MMPLISSCFIKIDCKNYSFSLQAAPFSRDSDLDGTATTSNTLANPSLSSSKSFGGGSRNKIGAGSHPSSSSAGISTCQKKRSWYSALYPTYKQRSEDFKKIFTTVPPDERLVVGREWRRNYLFFYCKKYRSILWFFYPFNSIDLVTNRKEYSWASF